MVAIELDQKHEKELDQLAKAGGQDMASLARQIVTDYLNFHALPNDSEEAWANASVALAAQVMEQDNWDKADYGP
jgi:hypothetical protein